jgi:hypothetical protein
MREAAREALTLLRHEAEEQIEQSQYRHFLSRTQEGDEAVVMPAGDLDKAVKEVKLLEDHEEESS